VAALILLALLACSLIYCVLTVVAAVRYRAVRPAAPATFPPISVLKPLSGFEEELEQNLRTFFEQDYPAFEILFAVRDSSDPAARVVRRLQAEYPGVPARLVETGEPPYANAKVYSLDRMVAMASFDLVVMSDSDTRVTNEMLRVIAAEFADPAIGMVTCPYRAMAGRSFWSVLEAVGLNTEFLSGVLVARMLEGMKFALGPTIAARREVLARIGAFEAVKEYLAEDFVMGKLAAKSGAGVLLSSYVIEHRIGAQRFLANLKHRLRWCRSTRRSRPWGYVGQFFTNPLPVALALWSAKPEWWPVLVTACVLRALAGWATVEHVLNDRYTRRRWWLVPLQDLVQFPVWIGGFFGNTILWRGRKYYLLADGRFELLQ